MRKMRAKYPGQCRHCDRAIEPGDSILWRRGRGAVHVDCETARLRHTACTSCDGKGSRWNGVPCQSCDGSGLREMQDYVKAPNPHTAHLDGGPTTEDVTPWTESTTLEQVDSEMLEMLTGQPSEKQEFSGPTIGDMQPGDPTP